MKPVSPFLNSAFKKEMEYPHKPVMVNEVTGQLITSPDGIYVDATAATGGHSEAILKQLNTRGRLICMDRDSEALEIARKRLRGFEGREVSFKKANFSGMDDVFRELGIEKVDGILFDLGMSSYQLDHSGRGFSFMRDEPLDMRMDKTEGKDAGELLNNLSAVEIEKILKKYGEEKRARLISKAIVKEREKSPIRSTGRLADLIRSNFPSSPKNRKKDPATRTFQALRILVNGEMQNLENILNKAPELINRGGRVLFLTYHSLEDRLVKTAMVDWEKSCHCPPDFPVCVCNRKPLFRRLNKRGLRPGQGEIDDNPRARSARLRSAERI